MLTGAHFAFIWRTVLQLFFSKESVHVGNLNTALIGTQSKYRQWLVSLLRGQLCNIYQLLEVHKMWNVSLDGLKRQNGHYVGTPLWTNAGCVAGRCVTILPMSLMRLHFVHPYWRYDIERIFSINMFIYIFHECYCE